MYCYTTIQRENRFKYVCTYGLEGSNKVIDTATRYGNFHTYVFLKTTKTGKCRGTIVFKKI